jgi:hypothetical protein
VVKYTYPVGASLPFTIGNIEGFSLPVTSIILSYKAPPSTIVDKKGAAVIDWEKGRI